MKGRPETWQDRDEPPPPPSSKASPLRLSLSVSVWTPTCTRHSPAQALAPFPVSACRLLALSEGQLSAVGPTLPLQTTIKSSLFWAGGESEKKQTLHTQKHASFGPPLSSIQRGWHCLFELVLGCFTDELPGKAGTGTVLISLGDLKLIRVIAY